ncbi:hypothetical protein F5148DRAFT_1295415 [Russula earlei]|uniref:Uncharacterized protein n=1 Tax=Russula earlei TaxID=71964 RepID=A0ACC0TT47_9AGAM|nr:hypothetical protein F5148DRAFT_1295415 [Russula earlei]
MAPFAATGGHNDFSKWLPELGYGGYIKYQLSHTLGIQADFLRGTLQGNDDKLWSGVTPPGPYQSFKTEIHWATSLSGVITIGNINWSQLHTAIQPYISLGGGAVNFNPTMTRKNTGTTVDFKSDGSSVTEFYIPVGIGIKANLSRSINLDLGYTMAYVDADNLDGYEASPYFADKFSYAHIGLEFALGNTTKPQLARHNAPAQLAKNMKDENDAMRASLAASEERYNRRLAEINTLRDNLNSMKIDSDGDGVADFFDKCPGTPQGIKVDGAGCPLPVTAPAKDTVIKVYNNTYVITEEDKKVVSEAIRNLEFDFGKASIRDRSLPYLDKVAAMMVKKGFSLKLAGHTDAIGSDAANMKLSKDRAESIKTYLVSQGVNNARIEAVGYGKMQPIATNKTEEGRQKNRRLTGEKYKKGILYWPLVQDKGHLVSSEINRSRMIASTPKPPYYAVIFTSLRTPEDAGYAEMSDRMVVLAQQQPGYLGHESAREGIGITVSYWESLEAIRNWKQHTEHLFAQQQGRAQWYSTYKTRICLVERDYGYRLCLVGTLIVTTYFVRAQNAFVFTPLKDDTIALAKTFAKVTEYYTGETKVLQGENKKYIADIYKERFDNVKEMFDKRELLTSSPEAIAYLNALTAEIIKANPVLQPLPIHFYFAKTADPNAASVGEGVIIFNIGLFTKLDNESQVVFILCHELAHLYLKHSDNSINKYVNTLYSKETQEKLSKIKNTEFQKREQLEKLLKGMTFTSKRHSRDHESEADSMGLVFMKNTNFDVHEALTCLVLLDSVDVDTFHTAGFLQQQFNSKEYPFKQRWTRKEEGLLGGYANLETDKELEDSLKTHPDCKIRIIALQAAVNQYRDVTRKKDMVDKAAFYHLQQVLPYETVWYYYTSSQYSLCLFNALEILNNKPGDPFLIAIIGKAFNGIAAAQKNHTFSKVADMPAPYRKENYNTLLQFIQNMYIEEVATVNYYYLKQYETQLSSYNEYISAFETSKRFNKQ